MVQKDEPMYQLKQDYPAGMAGGKKELATDINVDTKEDMELEKTDKRCSICKYYEKTYELCAFSGGDEDYYCESKKWELAEC